MKRAYILIALFITLRKNDTDIPVWAETMPSILRQNQHVETTFRCQRKMWAILTQRAHSLMLLKSYRNFHIYFQTLKKIYKLISCSKTILILEIEEVNISILTLQSENGRKKEEVTSPRHPKSQKKSKHTYPDFIAMPSTKSYCVFPYRKEPHYFTAPSM